MARRCEVDDWMLEEEEEPEMTSEGRKSEPVVREWEREVDGPTEGESNVGK